MKVKMLISMLVAGFLATSIGYAAGEDNVGTDSNNGTSSMSGMGEMGAMSGMSGMGDTQNDNSATQDTTTSDEDY